MAGSILMLVGINLALHATGTFDLPAIQVLLHTPASQGGLELPPTTEMLLFLAFFLAFAIKVPLFLCTPGCRMRTWKRPRQVRVMLAGVLLKMGTYGMIASACRFSLRLRTALRAGWPYWRSSASFTARWWQWSAELEEAGRVFVGHHLGFVVLGISPSTTFSMQGAVYHDAGARYLDGRALSARGMVYDRRGIRLKSASTAAGHADAKLAAFFLFVALSSLACRCQWVVREYLVLPARTSGTGSGLHGPTRVILSAATCCVVSAGVFGEIPREKPYASPMPPRAKSGFW